MKIRNVLLTVLATSIALAACDKSENPNAPSDKTPKSVTITLPNINQTPGVRATGDAMDGSQAALKNFKVFFLDAAGAVQTAPQYDGKAQPVYFDAADETWQAIEAAGRTITYHFLPAAVSQVVVVGNLGDIAYSSVNASYDVLNDGDADVATDDNGHPLYPLYGKSGLTPKTGTDGANHNNVYTASVSLAPQIARFEIYGFTYTKDETAEYTYDDIKLDRIALSNYRTQYNLATGAAQGDAEVCPAGSTEVWDWIAATASPWADQLDATVGQGAKVFVDGTDIPASNTNGNGATGIVTFGLTKPAAAGDNPELLLSFYGEKEGQSNAPLYLRGKFTSTTFEPGKIYRVLFPIEDASWTQPERCVELTVTVKSWEIVTVTPTF